MPGKTTGIGADLHAYVVSHCSARDAVLDELVAETRTLGGISMMQVAEEQAALLTLLARLLGARNAVEVGTFTGLSALAIARGLAPGGRLLCCDVSLEWTALARRAWQRAGVAERIDLRIAPAAETLAALPPDPVIDLAFIDADKTGYMTYYEALVPRLRPGGIVVLDNVLWGGSVIDPVRQEDDVRAIRAVNERVATDPRVEAVMLPVADGITLARRRAPGEMD